MDNNWKRDYIFSWSTKSELRDMVYQSKERIRTLRRKTETIKTKNKMKKLSIVSKIIYGTLIIWGLTKIMLDFTGVLDMEPVWRHGLTFVFWGITSIIDERTIGSQRETIDQLFGLLKEQQENFDQL